MAGDYGGMPTRYGALFGTPERAAETLSRICDDCKRSACAECPIGPLTGFEIGEDKIADWLRGGYMVDDVRGSLGH